MLPKFSGTKIIETEGNAVLRLATAAVLKSHFYFNKELYCTVMHVKYLRKFCSRDANSLKCKSKILGKSGTKTRNSALYILCINFTKAI